MTKIKQKTSRGHLIGWNQINHGLITNPLREHFQLLQHPIQNKLTMSRDATQARIAVWQLTIDQSYINYALYNP